MQLWGPSVKGPNIATFYTFRQINIDLEIESNQLVGVCPHCWTLSKLGVLQGCFQW